MQNSETRDETKSVVGKGHSPTGIGFDVLELWVLEFAGWLENRYLLGATKDGL
jgi:hypothetical protein